MAMAYNISSSWNGTLPGIVINPSPPEIYFPTSPPPCDYYSFNNDLFTYIVVIFLLALMLSLMKVAVNRRRARQTALRNARTRQGQVATVSGSVDSNSINLPDTASTSQTASVEHTKVDLPPTYDEVMKVFLQAKETAAAPSSETNVTAVHETTTCAAVQIDIEETPPPQYGIVIVQSS